MQLGRYNVSTLRPTPINSVRFSFDGRFFAVSSEGGYEVWRTYPLELIKRRSLQGTLGLVIMLQGSLLVLQGGGSNPLYSPNKAIIYSDKQQKAVAELEFSERIRGIVARNSTIVVALSHRVAAFAYGTCIGAGCADSSRGATSAAHPSVIGKEAEPRSGFWVEKIGEWATAENEMGLMAISTTPGSTLLALPGRQPGHVQLISLPPCPFPDNVPPVLTTPNTFRSPIILAHTHPLSSLSCTQDGSKIITTSERGTLLRVWDTARGHLERELRRGVDRAVIWGATFEPPPPVARSGKAVPTDIPHSHSNIGDVAGWSDKGTIHVWSSSTTATGHTANPPPSLTHMISRTLPLPKYFTSPASFAQYHLPRKNPHAFASVVGAAAGKAGVRGKGLEVEEGDEWAERFVVSWVWVDPDPTATISKGASGKEAAVAGDQHAKEAGSVTMGSREERRSFGSDITSRTATPTFRPHQARDAPDGRDTPTMLLRRQSSMSSNDTSHVRGRSGSSTSMRLRPKPSVIAASASGTFTNAVAGPSRHVNVSPTTLHKTLEDKGHHELVAITFSGDWYRLRLPAEVRDDTDKTKERKGKCELVEYRRLGVGGGGW